MIMNIFLYFFVLGVLKSMTGSYIPIFQVIAGLDFTFVVVITLMFLPKIFSSKMLNNENKYNVNPKV